MEHRQYKFELFIKSLSPAQLLMLNMALREASQSNTQLQVMLAQLEAQLRTMPEELASNKTVQELNSFTVLIDKT